VLKRLSLHQDYLVESSDDKDKEADCMGGPDRDPTLAAAKRALDAREYENVVSVK